MAIYESEFTTPGSSARIWLVLQVDVVSQNIETNQTTLNWYVRGEERVVNASPYNLAAGRSGSATVGGTVWSTGSSTYDFRASFAVNYWASGTTVITHDADGTKSITVAASYNSNDSILGTASFSTTLVLPTIPRATTPTVSPSSGETAQAYTIGHDPASSSFYHDVAYGFDGEGGSFTDIATNIIGTDVSTDWTPAHSLITDATSDTATIRLITRDGSGGTIIGTKYINLPLSVPSSVKPTISSVLFADAQVSSPDLPALMGGVGRFVQRWSKLQPTVTAAGASGSTVTDTDVTVNGQTVDSGSPFPSAIALSGSVPYSAIATDSRGRVSTAFTGTVPVTAYNFPSLPTPTVQRTSDAAGNIPDPQGTYLAITPAASVSDLTFGGVQKNLLEYQIRWRLKGAGSWTTAFAWGSSGVTGFTWTGKKVLAGALSTAEYEVEVSIRDLFGKNGFDTANTVKTLTVNVASESVDIDFNENIGIAFGRYHSGSGARIQVKDGLAADTITQDGEVVIDEASLATALAALLPSGMILPTARSSAPSGWLLCDGSAVSRTTYADLFAAIGTTYGAGNGSTTFNVPNLKGRVPVGIDTGQAEFDVRGETGGSKTHTLTVAEMPGHNHDVSGDNSLALGRINGTPNGDYLGGSTGAGQGGWGFAIGTGNNNITRAGVTKQGGGGAHNNLQPYMALHYCIKT